MTKTVKASYTIERFPDNVLGEYWWPVWGPLFTWDVGPHNEKTLLLFPDEESRRKLTARVTMLCCANTEAKARELAERYCALYAAPTKETP